MSQHVPGHNGPAPATPEPAIRRRRSAKPDPLWDELVRGARIGREQIDEYTHQQLARKSPWGDKPRYDLQLCVRLPKRIPTADQMLDDIFSSKEAGLTAGQLEVAIFNRWMAVQAELVKAETGNPDVWFEKLSEDRFVKNYYGEDKDRFQTEDDED